MPRGSWNAWFDHEVLHSINPDYWGTMRMHDKKCFMDFYQSNYPYDFPWFEWINDPTDINPKLLGMD